MKYKIIRTDKNTMNKQVVFMTSDKETMETILNVYLKNSNSNYSYEVIQNLKED